MDGAWPPPPSVNEVVYFGGFPGCERIEIKTREFSFGLHSGTVPLTDFTDYQLACRFDRRYWVDVRSLGLPPVGYDLGGVSGGAMLQPVYRDGAWGWRLGWGDLRSHYGGGVRADHRRTRALHFTGWAYRLTPGQRRLKALGRCRRCSRCFNSVFWSFRELRRGAQNADGHPQTFGHVAKNRRPAPRPPSGKRRPAASRSRRSLRGQVRRGRPPVLASTLRIGLRHGCCLRP